MKRPRSKVVVPASYSDMAVRIDYQGIQAFDAAWVTVKATGLDAMRKNAHQPRNDRDTFFFNYGLYLGLMAATVRDDPEEKTAEAVKEAECQPPMEQL